MTINQISLKASSIARGLGAITFLLVIASTVEQFALYLTEQVSISQLAIAESPDNEKENLAFTLNQLPRPNHVVIVIEENKSYKQIIGNI